MLTVDEFERACRSHYHWRLGALVAALFAALFGTAAAEMVMVENAVAEGVEEMPSGCDYLTCAWPLLYILSSLLLGVWLFRFLRGVFRDDRLRCPRCRQQLFWRWKWVRDNRRCTRCGRPVLEGAGPVRLLTRAEFDAIVAASANRPEWIVVYAALSAIMFGLMFAAMLWANVRFPNSPLTMYGGLCLPLAVFLPILWFIGPKARPDPRLVCPHCGGLLYPRRVWERNECVSCRRPVLADEPTGLAGTSPPG